VAPSSLRRVPSPRPLPPPLTRWGEGWRITVAVLGGLLAWLGQFDESTRPGALLPLLDLVVGVPAIVALHWRRRWPAGVATLTTLATTVSGMAGFASLIAFISLVTTRRWRAIVPVGLVGVGSGYVYDGLRPASSVGLPWWAVLVFSALVMGIAVVIGLYVGARRELAAAARDRIRTAEREQEARVEQARMGERARIAREMHDVLAHRISLVSLHAGAMTYRTDLGVDELRASARVVQENAHQALGELRDVLGVLRDPAAGPALTATAPPQPTLADLPALVLEARDAGTPVDLSTRVADLAAVPDTVGRTAYRVVQEALTNARKHAPGSLVLLEVSGSPGSQLEIVVENRLPRSRVAVGGVGTGPEVPGAGLGLVGLAERAALAGGGLVHGPTAAQEYRVAAWLPWPA